LATWDLIDGCTRSVRSYQETTESPPTVDDGVNISGCDAMTIWLMTETGETISAETGQVDIYQYDPDQWGYVPALAVAVPPGSTGRNRVQMGTFLIDNPRGRIAPLCNGISVTGGKVYLDILFSYSRNAGRVPV
jgi:hypothetical protein